MITYAIRLCGEDDRLEIPNPDCPRSELHTPSPRGYVEWFEWMASMRNKGARSARCPGCDLYVIVAGGRP